MFLVAFWLEFVLVPDVAFAYHFEGLDTVICDVDYAACSLELGLHDALVYCVIFYEKDVHFVEVGGREGGGEWLGVGTEGKKLAVSVDD